MLSGRSQPDPERIFSGLDLAGRKAVIAAVSGGSDSLALLLLLKSHLDRSAADTALVAVTVDHGLRPQSADEARAVATLCAAQAIVHRMSRWEGDKPAAGLSAAARAARYRLLADAARAAGTDLVLTGHTRDDQAATVLMRQRRGTGRGLAGMAPATLYDGRVWIVRPLLDTGREALRDVLRAAGIAWIDDPTNEKPEYERVRARRELEANANPETRKRALLETASRHAAERVEAGRDAAAVIGKEFGRVARGLYRLRYGHGGHAGHGFPKLDARLYALRILLACAGGSVHLPDEARTAGVISELASGRFRATLSRAVVDARSSGVFLYREFRGQGPTPIAVQDGAIWDGRYRIRVHGKPEPGLFVAPFGREWAAQTASDVQDIPVSLVRAALAAEPALWRDGACLGLVSSGEGRHQVAAIPVLAPWAKFLPSFDLAPARAMAALLGAESVPEPPFAGHNRA